MGQLGERAQWSVLLGQAIERVRGDREHGASWLAREAARALEAAAATLVSGIDAGRGDDPLTLAEQLRTLASELAHARPSMAPLATTVAHAWAAGWPSGAHPRPETADASLNALSRVRAEAARLAAAWDEASQAIAGHARTLLHGTVFTHSRSGTVERVLTTLAAEPGRLARVVVTESRPGGEGVATARALAAAGLPVTLVADAALGLEMDQVTSVVLGADSLRADGSLVNKVGSYPLALAARTAGGPVYVLCETLKIAPEVWPLVLEEMDPAELLPMPIPGVTVRNVYFDRTPAAYLSAIITERGILAPADVNAMARSAAQELQSLDGTADTGK
jgi:ribose 1,5-bisphosphate isomerase